MNARHDHSTGFFRIEQVYYADMPVPLYRNWWHRLFPKKYAKYLDMPTYEAALISGLIEFVPKGGKVVVVGAGVGVTAAVSARLVGPSGTVVCLEGSSQCIEQSKGTLELNDLAGTVELVHAIVGTDISVYESSEKASVLPADQLPNCDVLELDCEGAETKILREMTIRPETILVETHGSHGAPTQEVSCILEDLGYSVKNLGVAEPYLADYCIEKDIFVLAAVKTR